MGPLCKVLPLIGFSDVLSGGRPAATSAHLSTRASSGTNNVVATLTTRPAGSNTRYRFRRSNGGTNGGGGTQRSGNTGRSPRDRNVRALEASTETQLFDDDSSIEPTGDFIIDLSSQHDMYIQHA